jgi:hypothetical protein
MLERLKARKAELIQAHLNAQAVLEQTRGALSIVDEMIKELEVPNVGGSTNGVEATDSSERGAS